jgi:hypothetical protein
MTQKTYTEGEKISDRQPTAMEQLLNRFIHNNDRLGNLTEGFENLGHKLANTNHPKPESPQAKMAALVQNDGVLSDLERRLNAMDGFIARLEETGKKISELV